MMNCEREIWPNVGEIIQFSKESPIGSWISQQITSEKNPTSKMNRVEKRRGQLKEETANIAKKIEILEISKRKLLGQGIGSCSMNELQEIDNQLERSLKIIRARKSQLFKDEIQRLKERERLLREENARLSEKCGGVRPAALELPVDLTRPAQLTEKDKCSRMETDLNIGLPDIGWS